MYNKLKLYSYLLHINLITCTADKDHDVIMLYKNRSLIIIILTTVLLMFEFINIFPLPHLQEYSSSCCHKLDYYIEVDHY